MEPFKINIRKSLYLDDVLDILMVVSLCFIIPYQGNLFAKFGMCLSMALSVINIIKNRYFEKKVGVIFTFHLILILYFYFHIITGASYYSNESSTRLIEMLVNLVWGYFICRYFYLRENDRIIWILITTVIILAVMQISEVGISNLRETITAFNINTLSLLCGYSAVFVFYFFKEQKRTIFLLLFLFCSLVVLMSGSRQAILSEALPLMLIIVFKNRKNKLARVFLILGGIFVIYLILMENPFLYNVIGYRIENTITALTTGSTNEVSMTNRMTHYVRAMGLIRKNPVWGYGLDSYRLIVGSTVYSHSNYMELLVSGGIIAFVIYYIPFIIMVVNLVKIREKEVFTYVVLGILATQIFEEYFLVAYYRHFTMLIYVILLVFYERIISRKDCGLDYNEI